MSVMNRAVDDSYREHSKAVVQGFDALRDEYRALDYRCNELQSRLETLANQYEELAKQYLTSEQRGLNAQAVESNSKQALSGKRDVFEAEPENLEGSALDRASEIRKAQEAYEHLTSRHIDAEHWAWKDGYRPPFRKARTSGWVHSRPTTDSTLPMEQDFTTQGAPSRLGCPFNTLRGRKPGSRRPSVQERHREATPLSLTSDRGPPASRRSKPPSFADPIRAELCGNDPLSPPGSAADSATAAAGVAACPIRFLDQHSPEEVAKYFENHKHEIPRSHEVCVRRYQSNSQSIRQLDAKYGNLVSMIQGLGAKHQPMLPETPAQDESATRVGRRESIDKVEKWAKAVSTGPMMEADVDHEAADEKEEEKERIPHSDRPLKEIRVGESPSRPWGIPVPLKYDDEGANMEMDGVNNVADSPAAALEVHTSNVDAKPVGTCPFGHQASQPQGPEPAERQVDAADIHTASGPAFVHPQSAANGPEGAPQPQMLFTGPVFIGYPMEQAIALLQRSALSGKP